MYNSKTPKVYKNNNLNNANFSDFNLTDYQIFLHLVTKIGGVDDKGKYLQPQELKREYTLTAKEFSHMFNSDIHNTYKALRKSCKKLMKTSILLQHYESTIIYEINICSRAIYNLKEASITIKFTDDIMPYLSQVRQKFVLYNLKEISNFNSLYTTRLYELIQSFKDTGLLVKSISQLREIFSVGDKFKKYNDFKKRTFQHAVQEINNNYDINLQFDEIKMGRSINAIKFTFKPVFIQQIIDSKTGNERNIYIKPKQLQLEI